MVTAPAISALNFAFSGPHVASSATSTTSTIATTATATTTTTSSSPTAVSATSTLPTGRLRGLSYLRHYTHAHGRHHGTPVATTATIITATATTTAGAAAAVQVASSSFSSVAAIDTSATPSPSLPLQLRRATSPLTNPGANSWIPTVSGVSGLSRDPSSLAAAEVSASSAHATPPRSITELMSPPSQQHTASTMPSNHVSTDPPLPSIRFTPYIDLRSNRESLHFAPIERSLRHKDERIKVGRASERDANNPLAPVGFSSKVVSRRHCEFWCDNGQWYVKDVKSSSGTFLNHIRLSAPGLESKAYPINDGDILQLGIDFKGGEEQIFRCVKIRVELNRAWQKGLNNFNMSAHRRLRSLASAGKESDACSISSSECAICLLPVAPCQSLFVAPCSHVWHYKCIRPLVEKEYPSFLCPNCRAVADLSREIEEDEFGDGVLWDAPASVPEVEDAVTSNPVTAVTTNVETPTSTVDMDVQPVASEPIPATPPRQINTSTNGASRRHPGSDDDSTGSRQEGPLTPVNDAGPFVLDGGSARGRRETLFLPLATVQSNS